MLQALFVKYGTDKAVNGYAPTYTKVLAAHRKTITRVLEIGIGTMIPGVHSSMADYARDGYRPGGSLRAWRDYFANATITGLDIQPDTQFTEERINTVLGDSTDPVVAQQFPDEHFDLIIDDGDHARQFHTMTVMWPKLKVGGTYVIEDIWGAGVEPIMVMTRHA